MKPKKITWTTDPETNEEQSLLFDREEIGHKRAGNKPEYLGELFEWTEYSDEVAETEEEWKKDKDGGDPSGVII
jgi:hypothetical protein